MPDGLICEETEKSNSLSDLFRSRSAFSKSSRSLGCKGMLLTLVLGESNSQFLPPTNRFGELFVGERERLPEELSNRQFGDRTVNPSRSSFVTAQRIHPAFHFLADPDCDSILCPTTTLLVFDLSFRIGLHTRFHELLYVSSFT